MSDVNFLLDMFIKSPTDTNSKVIKNLSSMEKNIQYQNNVDVNDDDDTDDDTDNNNIIYFQCIGSNNNNLFTPQSMYENITNMQKMKNFICEYNNTTDPIKPYIDYAETIDSLMDIDTFNTYIKKQLRGLIELVKDGMLKIGIYIDDSDIYICEAFGQCKEKDKNIKTYHKIYFHIVLDIRERFSCNKQAFQLVEIINECCDNPEKKIIYKNINKNIYSANNVRYLWHDVWKLSNIRDKCTQTYPINGLINSINSNIYPFLLFHENTNTTIIPNDLYLSIIEDSENVENNKDNKDNEDNEDNEGISVPYILNNEDFKKIVNMVLRKIPSAKFFRKKQNYWTFEYDYLTDTCLPCSKHHKCDNFIKVTPKGNVIGGCLSIKCKEKFIDLGSLIEKENRCKLFEQCSVLEKNNEQYLSDNTIDTLGNWLLDDITKIICLKSSCGSGKTNSFLQIINRWILKYPKTRILLISTKISYAHDVMHNTLSKIEKSTGYKFNNYKDLYTKKAISKLSSGGLIISLESLHKLTGDRIIMIYDLIILDESESIYQQNYSETIERYQDPRTNFFYFTTMLENARKIILIDAMLSDSSLQMVTKGYFV